jgi:hypothetical protein
MNHEVLTSSFKRTNNFTSKKIILLSAIAFISLKPITVSAQKIEDVLQQTYTAFDTTWVYSQKLQATNKFKLIATKWPDNWAANFYAAWSLSVLSFTEPDNDKKDPMLDEAEKYYAKIAYMDSTNDEVNVLGALIAQARLSVNPMMRHAKYGEIAGKYYDKALSLNPNNPRVFYLKGNSLFYTPAAFGGGVDKAQVLYEKAETLFANDSKDIMKPHWGKLANEYMLKQCKDKAGK